MASNKKIEYTLDINAKLTDDLIEISKNQGEDPLKVQDVLKRLRGNILENDMLNLLRTDDDFLIKFLRSVYWNEQKAYKLMCGYIKFREDNKSFYHNVNPLSLLCLGEEDIISVMPLRDENGRRYVIYKMGNWTPSICPVIDLYKITMLLIELVSMEPQSQILGSNVLADLSNLSIKNALYFTPSHAKRLIQLILYSMPIRINQVHIINNGYAFQVLWSLLKPILSEEIISRIFIHGKDLSSLHKHMDKESLPTIYGGYLQKFCYKPWIYSIAKNADILAEITRLGYKLDDEEIKHYQQQ